MVCPVLVSVDGVDGMFMGETASDLFVSDGRFVWRYTFPGLSFVEEVYDTHALTLPSPDYDNTAFIQSPSSGNGDVCCGPDGDFFHLIWAAGDTSNVGLFRIPADGSSADLIHDFGTMTGVTIAGRVSWLPADSDNIWCHVLSTSPDAEDALYQVAIDGSGATLRLDRIAEGVATSNFWASHYAQYDTGLVMDINPLSGGSISGFLVYDVVSHTWDTISTDADQGGYYVDYTTRKIRWHLVDPAENIHQVGITDTSPVTLAGGETPDCSPLRGYFEYPPDLDDWFKADAQNFLAPTNRSRIFFDDTSNIWELRVPGGWTVGRVAWGSRGGWH